jgi:conjugal transfer pilus assembly protein TraF
MKYAFFAVLCSVCCVVTAAEQTTHKDYRKGESKSFFDNKREGWFWFQEETDEPIKKKKPLPQEPIVILAPAQESEAVSTQSETKTVVINAAWLRENLPELKETAINNPSDDNLKAYYYAQRMTADMATRFAMRTKDFFIKENELDESKRRPTSAFAINEHKANLEINKKKILGNIFKDTGIWMFVRSDCSYCKKQLPVMGELERVYGVDILYISTDGAQIAGHDSDNYVFDTSGEARASIGLDIQKTPTMLLVRNDSTDAILLSEGMMSLPELAERTLRIAKVEKWITDVEYNITQGVNDISTLQDDETLSIEVPIANDSESDTKALVEKLKARLKNTAHSTANNID